MKKIINGKLYDTDTAKEVGSWANYGSWRDFNHMEETLYRKRTGEFFLFGEGGPSTKYARRTEQNMWSGGSQIIPLSPEAAREWAEEHLNADDYAELFGMPDEGGEEKVTLCVQLPAALDAKIRAGAAQAGKSLTAYLESVLSEALK